MFYSTLRVAVLAIVFFAIAGSLVFMLTPMLEKEPGWMRRSVMGIASLVVSTALLIVSVAFFNHVHIRNAGVSAREAVVVAVYADGMKKPTTIKQADSAFMLAVDKAETNDNLTIAYRKVFPYEFSMVASTSQGTNVAAVCVWFNKMQQIWVPMISDCPSTPLVRVRRNGVR